MGKKEGVKKLNCWEVKQCGRETGGVNAAELGICSASTLGKANGIHGGKNGGRICWMIAGTLCDEGVQSDYSSKIKECSECGFFKSVKEDAGDLFLSCFAVKNKLRK